MIKNLLSGFGFILLLSINLFAQTNSDLKFSAQVQLRSEIDGRDFNDETPTYTYTSLRTRIGASKTFANRFQLLVQLQDSRIFGNKPEVLSTIGSNIDLHQGYVSIIKPFDLDMNIQVGRFEVKYGTERLFGTDNWHYVGRSFNGFRFEIAPSSFPTDLFALRVHDNAPYIGFAVLPSYPLPVERNTPNNIIGLYKLLNLTHNMRVDLLFYFENNSTKTIQGEDSLKMFTLAGTIFWSKNSFSTIIETAYQFGKTGASDINSYLISLSGKYNMKEMTLGAGFDLLSGTKMSSNNFNTFNASYGSNTKFYGYMDYFIKIPVNTLWGGFNDFYLRYDYLPEGSKFALGVDFHHFMSNKPRQIVSNEFPSGVEQSVLGQEIDLFVKYNIIKGTAISLGGSLFFPGDLMKVFFQPGEDPVFWTYIMITANL